jgi:hypothetical protein
MNIFYARMVPELVLSRTETCLWGFGSEHRLQFSVLPMYVYFR